MAFLEHEFPTPVYKNEDQHFIIQHCIHCKIQIKRYRYIYNEGSIVYLKDDGTRHKGTPNCLIKKIPYSPVPSLLDSIPKQLPLSDIKIKEIEEPKPVKSITGDRVKLRPRHKFTFGEMQDDGKCYGSCECGQKGC